MARFLWIFCGETKLRTSGGWYGFGDDQVLWQFRRRFWNPWQRKYVFTVPTYWPGEEPRGTPEPFGWGIGP